MQRVSIVEKKTGCCLYDRIWKWKKEQQTPGAIASLIQFFYQFAAEVDTGEVTKVIFKENPHEGGSRVSSKQRFSNLNLSIGKFNRSQIRRRSQAFTQRAYRSIAMYSAVSDLVILALFVTSDFQRPEELARLLLDAFVKTFSATVNQHLPKLLEIAKTPEAALLSSAFLEDFKSFDDQIMPIIDKHCPPATTPSSGNTAALTEVSSTSTVGGPSVAAAGGTGGSLNKLPPSSELGARSISTLTNTGSSLHGVDSTSQLLLNSNLSSSGPGSGGGGGAVGTTALSSTSVSAASSAASSMKGSTSPISRPSMWEAPRLSVSGLKETRIELKENHNGSDT